MRALSVECRVWEKRAGAENDGSGSNAERLIILLARQAIWLFISFIFIFADFCLQVPGCLSAGLLESAVLQGRQSTLASGPPLVVVYVLVTCFPSRSWPKLVFISLSILHTFCSATTPLQASHPLGFNPPLPPFG